MLRPARKCERVGQQRGQLVCVQRQPIVASESRHKRGEVGIAFTEIKRSRARRNPGVNGSWICDEGRYGYQQAMAAGRPTKVE